MVWCGGDENACDGNIVVYLRCLVFILLMCAGRLCELGSLNFELNVNNICDMHFTIIYVYSEKLDNNLYLTARLKLNF